MSACDEFIEKVANMLPEQCKVTDLVKAGIYTSPQTATQARTRGDCPDYFQLGRRIIYPRNAVIQWLKEKKHESRQASHLC